MKRSDSVESVHLLTARQASELIPGVGAQALLRWARQGEVAHVRLPNGRVYFRRADIEALLTPVAAAPASHDAPAPSSVAGVSAGPFVDVPLPGFAAAV